MKINGFKSEQTPKSRDRVLRTYVELDVVIGQTERAALGAELFAGRAHVNFGNRNGTLVRRRRGFLEDFTRIEKKKNPERMKLKKVLRVEPKKNFFVKKFSLVRGKKKFNMSPLREIA